MEERLFYMREELDRNQSTVWKYSSKSSISKKINKNFNSFLNKKEKPL
jgi:hypothetical protein